MILQSRNWRRYSSFWLICYDAIILYVSIFILWCLSFLPLLQLQTRLLYNAHFAKATDLKMKRADLLNQILA